MSIEIILEGMIFWFYSKWYCQNVILWIYFIDGLVLSKVINKNISLQIIGLLPSNIGQIIGLLPSNIL